MINELNGLKGPQELDAFLETIVTDSQKVNKEALVALSKIQVGDLLKGKILLEQEKTFLKLESGLKLLAHLPKDISMPQLLDFIVVGKERQQLILELATKPGGEEKSQSTLPDEVIKGLGLKESPEMKELVGQFISKQLPLVREQLLQVYHLAKNYHLPVEVLTNFASNQEIPKEKEFQLLSTIKENHLMDLEHSVEDLLEGIDPKQHNTLAKGLLTSLDTKVAREDLLEVMKSVLDENQPQLEENGKWQNSVKIAEEMKDTLIKTLETIPPDKLKELNKLLIEKQVTVDLEQLKEGKFEEIEKLTETSAKLKKVLTTLEENTQNDQGKVQIQKLESTLQVLEKFNMEGQYFCFPLRLKNQETSGELYFFRPKKNKNQQGQGMYIVLALDMPALKKIEVHLVEKAQQIRLKLKVENEAIKEQFALAKEELMKKLNDNESMIEQIEIEILSHMKKGGREVNTEEPSSLSRLDFKV